MKWIQNFWSGLFYDEIERVWECEQRFMKSYIELRRESYVVETPVVGRVRLQLDRSLVIKEIQLSLYEVLHFSVQANRHTEKPF